MTKAQTYTEDVQRIARRIDAIGTRYTGGIYDLSWYYIRLLLLSGVGWAMDSMETLVFTYLATKIKNDIPQSNHQQSFLAGAVFVGSFFGSFGFGNLMDMYGRRPMFLVTLVIFLFGLGLCGLSWNITSLTIFRIFGGIGLGGELPVASTLVQELSPAKTRGKIIVLLEAFWAIGAMIAIALAFGVEPHTGWRGLFYILCIPVIYGAVVRFMIPESPKWLASVGRYDEAVAIVEDIERAHGLSPYDEKEEDMEVQPLTPPQFELPESHVERIKLLFRKPFSVRTSVLWVLWMGISLSYYAVFLFLPSLIGKTGYNMNGRWQDMLFITAWQLPGYLFASWFVEILGRKNTLVLFLLGSFGSAVAFAYVPANQTPVMLTGSMMSFFLLGAWGCVYAYTPENYPTGIRGIGAAYPAGFSRIGAFYGPYLCSDMLGWNMSLKSIMWTFGGVLLAIAAIVLVFGYEPRGKNVEVYNEDDKVEAKEGFLEVVTPAAATE